MNVLLRTPVMTRDEFLDWVERQEAPYEFDGFAPVPMTGGTLKHALLCSNLLFALRKRLEDASFDVLPAAGVAIGSGAVRYADVLVLPTGGQQTLRLMPDPVIVFEVISPTSGRIDRTLKPYEYKTVASIRRYVIVDNTGPDIDIYARAAAQEEWVETSLGSGDTLSLPELGIEIPVAEIFRGVSFEISASGVAG